MNDHRTEAAAGPAATAGTDLQRAADGDALAVRRLVQRAGPWVNGLVRARHGDRPDLVVTIFERLWRECADYDPQAESELVFVARIARREIHRAGDQDPASAPTAAATRMRAEARSDERAEGPVAAPCDESRRLSPFLDRLRPEQVELLRAALHGGRDPSEGTRRNDQRLQLRTLLDDARRALAQGSEAR